MAHSEDSKSIMQILVVNTGSMSIKLDVLGFENDTVSRIRTDRYEAKELDPQTLLMQFLVGVEPLAAVVHRVVHGGGNLVESRIIDEKTENDIEALCDLAPLHNPVALRWIRACRSQLNVPQVAVFDSAFFDAMPEAAKRYAIPQQLAERFGIRRYGFHGIAHRGMWRRWCELRPDLPDGGKLISIQLGGGCSITAIRKGLPLDTSMGFSPTEGLVMATRCGDLDPDAIVHLMRNRDMSPEIVEKLINTQSGLLGVSGKSADLRDLVNEADAHSRLAVEIYCYRARKYVGAYLAVLAGADGIVFGGGVGEHMWQVRARILANMQWCGVEIDDKTNRRTSGSEAKISTDDSAVEIHVLPVNEAAILAGEAHSVLTKQPGVSP